MNNNSFYKQKKSAMKKYFSRMNPNQQEAVFTVKGPVLVLAGAGSGKTTVIVNRIANMIKFGNAYADETGDARPNDIEFLKDYADGEYDDDPDAVLDVQDIIAVDTVKPWNILAITFTNKAANELRERLCAMLGDDGHKINASTFHSACVRILRTEIETLGYGRDFTIYDSDDSKRLLTTIIRDEMDISEKVFAVSSVQSEISSAKNRMISPERMHVTAGQDYRKKIISRVYSTYQERLKQANALDFDDILVLTVEIFEKYPEILKKYQERFKYIMVDEYQDTNHVQFRLVSLLAGEEQNICVVGDDDQSIYSFRGADISNILDFEKHFSGAKVIRLEQNYRSTQTILDAANSVISHNNGRKVKTLWTDGIKGSKVYWYKSFDENDEARFIARTVKEKYEKTGKYSDNAVLYRMNAQSNSIEKAFVSANIPYRVYGGMRFYDRKEIRDIIAYMAFINNPYDMLRFKRIINEPKRSIGDATIALIEDISRDLNISPFGVMKNCEEYTPLAKKTAVLKSVAGMFETLIEKSYTLPLDEFYDFMLEKTGYLEYVQTLENADTKIEYIQEMRSSVVQYMHTAPCPTLSGFLEDIVLYTEADRDDNSEDKVTLMTVHSAKGLEYENVFVIGMEEGIFPSSRSFDNGEDLEEERRLAYVAITRAKNNLYLTSASQRMLFGQTHRNITSRFMREIGSELIEKHDNAVVMRNKTEANDNPVTAVYSSTLQQQLARNKMHSVSSTSNATYSAGERVQHNVFGAGTVISSTPMGNDAMLEIAFDSVGTKRIMANLARLKKI
ncbi:MAG: UvrD-helicase domain-containing protein [Ruminococcus flavefaciens]|nr:UvrD-helicase domain-containing protein [Ruminococcus flavefaciens]